MRARRGTFVCALCWRWPRWGSWLVALTRRRAGSPVRRCFPATRTRWTLRSPATARSWISGQDGGLLRLASDDTTKTIHSGEDASAPLTEGADGTVWAGAEQFAPSGALVRELDSEAGFSVLASAGDVLWTGTDGSSETKPRIQRISAGGASRAFALSAPRLKYGFEFHGIAAGADGGVWFTESDLRRGWFYGSTRMAATRTGEFRGRR